MEQQMKALTAYLADHAWAWVIFKYTVLPVFAVYEICKDRLPAIVAEYHDDVVKMDAQLAAYRADKAKPTVTTPAPK